MDSLVQLREDLWERWRESFDRFADPAPSPQSTKRVVYANAALFRLKGYTPHKFPAGGRMYPHQPEGTSSYYKYWLDAKGRPIHMACRHTVNHFDWEGFYRYADDEVEYIEFCLQTQVVSEYARITLRNGLPFTYQNIDINGGGSHIGGRKGKSAIDSIAQDSFFYWIEVAEYDALDGRVISGRALADGARQPQHRSTLEYSYSDSGRLERIVLIREDGSKYTSFAARSKVSMKELAARLSERIAVRTIEVLKKVDLGMPLQAVEISFRSVTNYVPGIIPATEADSVSDMSLVLATRKENWIELREEDFEPEMAEFLERMHATGNWDPGSKMLRKAALMVTELASGTLTIAEGFIAFAIDWEFEGHELLAILKQCGASAATLKRLKKIGWLK